MNTRSPTLTRVNSKNHTLNKCQSNSVTLPFQNDHEPPLQRTIRRWWRITQILLIMLSCHISYRSDKAGAYVILFSHIVVIFHTAQTLSINPEWTFQLSASIDALGRSTWKYDSTRRFNRKSSEIHTNLALSKKINCEKVSAEKGDIRQSYEKLNN